MNRRLGLRAVVVSALVGFGSSVICPQVACGGQQIPGDCNQDARLDISDAVCLLSYLFLGSPGELPCEDSSASDAANLLLLDWNADGGIDLSDAVEALTFLFLSGKAHATGQDCMELAGCPEACTRDACPTAVAQARLRGVEGPGAALLQAEPLQILELDGTGSSDFEGAPVASYEWDVSSSPPGSASVLKPGAGVPNPTFSLDLAGEYVFTLRVADGEGTDSCNTATVTAIVTPDAGIHVEVVWNTPGDPDRSEGPSGGSDLDLHFLHPNGEWNDLPWDCYWLNSSPSWGDAARADDDPRLERDDADGWGPEVTVLDAPAGEVGSPLVYRIGVHSFNDHGFGPSDCTVRIFIAGQKQFEATVTGLANGQFWEVAGIQWPTGQIEEIDIVHPEGFLKDLW